MRRAWMILLAMVLGACADELAPAPPEVRKQVERTMGAFAAMDVEGFKAGLAEDVVAYEIDVEGKPVRLRSRDDAVRYAEQMFVQVKKMGGSLKLNTHSSDCRATSTLAYCNVELDFQAKMPDGSTMSQPSFISVVLCKVDGDWKWMHWHSSLAALPPPPAPPPTP